MEPAYRFGPFRLEGRERRLTRAGEPIALPPRAFDALRLLVSRAGSLVSRQDLLEEVWSGAIVEEGNVTNTIWVLRRALEEEPQGARYIETIPKAGYRFVAEVFEEELERPAAEAESASAQRAQAGGEPVAARPRVDPAPAGSRDLGRGWTARRAGLLAIAVAVLVIVAVLLWRREPEPILPTTIAVLPFESIGDPERRYLADGLTEETIASLGLIGADGLSVIGRRSVMTYRDSARSYAEIGRELGARLLVDGSIRFEGDTMRVNAALISSRDQRQLWSISLDRKPESLLALQRELSMLIAEQVRLTVSAERRSVLERRQTANPEAYDLYLRGHYLWQQLTPATNRQALELFGEATSLDPGYALAWAGTSLVLAVSPINSDVPALAVWERSRQAARRAVAADPELAEAHAALGTVQFFLDWDWSGAERSFRRALELDPSQSFAHRLLGHVLSQGGRQAAAREAMARARLVDPFYAMTHANSSQIAFQARDYQAALAHARQALAVDPRFWIAHVMMGQASEQVGDHETAEESFLAAARLSGGNSKALGFRAHLLARTGREPEARELLAALAGGSSERYVPPYVRALVHAGLGERNAALDALDEAVEARDVHLVFLTVDPRWDPLRDDPGFRAVLGRCGFMPQVDDSVNEGR